MRFESYAQFFEDLVLYCALKDVDKGFYIDVGANDPTFCSVTKFFYDRGWRGINIEPLPDKCALLAELRLRDINLCVGLGAERGKLTLLGNNMDATFLEEFADGSEHKRLCPILTLSEVFDRYCPNQDVHFCKIDVEGYERQVLEGVTDWRKFRPWIFAMEATLPGTNIPCHDKWEDILLAHDYIPAVQIEINRYYVDAERAYLLRNFAKIDSFISQNEVVRLEMVNVKF